MKRPKAIRLFLLFGISLIISSTPGGNAAVVCMNPEYLSNTSLLGQVKSGEDHLRVEIHSPQGLTVDLPESYKILLQKSSTTPDKPEWRKKAEALQEKAGTGDPKDYPKILDAIEEIAEKKGFPPEILCGIIHRETRWDNKVGDNGNGFGVMQVDRRSHSKWLRHNNWRDIPANIEYSLSEIQDYYGKYKNISRALASYNAGPSRVTRAIKSGKSPDSPTTGKNYSKDILETAKKLGWDGKVPES